MLKFIFLIFSFLFGVFTAASVDHIHRTMWGWVWVLEPSPDFNGQQLVMCPNGDLVLPPWHVLVLYDSDAPSSTFLQERGR